MGGGGTRSLIFVLPGGGGGCWGGGGCCGFNIKDPRCVSQGSENGPILKYTFEHAKNVGILSTISTHVKW